MPSRKVGSVHTSPGRMNMPTFFLKSGCHCKRILINKQIISLKEKTNLGDIIGMCWVSRKDYVIADFWNIQEIQLNSDAPLAKWDSAKWSEWKSLSHIGLYETQWTIQSMEFSRPETGVGIHYLLQGVFPTQGSHPGLPHCRRILYQLSHQGRPGKPQVKGDILEKETRKVSSQAIIFF